MLPWLSAFSLAADFDGDRVDDALDDCPGVSDPAQTDTDLDGFGDVCDDCAGWGAGGTGFELGRPLLGNPGFDGAHSVGAADLDGDGDHDLLVAYSGGDTVAWYENRGADFGPPRIVGVPYGADTAVTLDADGDGDLDVAATASFADTLVTYENLGGGTFGPESIVDPLLDAGGPVAAADLDGDGDPDLVAASALGPLRWYENTAGVFAAPVVLDPSSGDLSTLEVTDLDQDGDPDLLGSARGFGQVTWYENLGGGAFGVRLVGLADDTRSAVPTDLDLDGDLDVLAAEYDGGRVVWFEHDGPTFGPAQELVAGLETPTSARVADLDGDGDLDLVTASYGGSEVTWYENSAGTFGVGQELSGAAKWVQGLLIDDLDGDGDADVVSASQDSILDGVGKVAWYENQGGTFGTEQTAPVAADGVSGLWAGDVDADGFVDLFYSAFNDDEFAWFAGTGAGFGDRQTAVTVDWAGQPHFADLDGDGDDDLIASEALAVSWWDNVGGTFGPRQELVVPPSGDHRLAIADFDADGDSDLAVSDDGLDWYENLGGAVMGPPIAVDPTLGASAEVIAADLDGDGDPDLVSVESEAYRVVWFENLGGSFGSKTTLDGLVFAVTAVVAADLDGDGDLDLAAGGGAQAIGEMVVYRNLGGGLFGMPAGIAPISGVTSITAADLDGDGDLDLASTTDGDWPYWSSDDAVWLHENLAGVQWRAPVALTLESEREYDFRDVVAADYDGDGFLDLVASAQHADAVVWYRNRSGCGPEATVPAETGDTGTTDTDPPASDTAVEDPPLEDTPSTIDRDEKGGCGCASGAAGGWLAVLLGVIGLANKRSAVR